MDPGVRKSLVDPVFIDIKGAGKEDRDFLLRLFKEKDINFYDSSESNETELKPQLPVLQNGLPEGNGHDPKIGSPCQSGPSNPPEGSLHGIPIRYQSGKGGLQNEPSNPPEGSLHGIPIRYQSGKGGLQNEPSNPPEKSGLQNGPSNPQTETGGATSPTNGGIKWNVKAPAFQPRGILMLQKTADQEQALNPKNMWASSSKSAASLFNSSVAKSPWIQNGHQTPGDGGTAAGQAALAETDEKRLSQEQLVRSGIRAVLRETRRVEQPRAKGIQNYTFSCYFNALFQSMLMVNDFASFLDSFLVALNRLSFDAFPVLQDIAPVSAALCGLWVDYKKNLKELHTVSKFHAKQLIHSLNSSEFALDRQSDPHELFMYLVEKLQVELKAVKQDRRVNPKEMAAQRNVDKSCPLQRMFKGRLGNVEHFNGRTDDDCEPFYTLQLSIHSEEITNVNQALESYFGYTVCSRTGKREKLCFAELPETLVVSFNNSINFNGVWKKVTKQIDLDEELVVSDNMLSGSLKGHLHQKRQRPSYRLISGFFHRGNSILGGHYVAFQRNNAGGWFMLDDEKVLFCEREDFFKYQKGDRTQVPHGLLYRLEFHH